MKTIIPTLVGLAALMFIATGLSCGSNFPSTKNFPIRGIDVSHHQNEIDWGKVKSQNVQFAYLKATEGGDFKDRKFAINWEEAYSAGIDVGAYHFFTFCRTGKEQAQNFIESVPVSKSALPPVIDLEFEGNCKLKLEDQTVIQEIDTIQRLLAAHYHKKAIFYTTNEFYNRFLINKFPDNPIWIRDIQGEPTLADNRKWTFWQYSNKENLEGVNTNVDQNVFNGTKEDYEKFKAGNTQF